MWRGILINNAMFIDCLSVCFLENVVLQHVAELVDGGSLRGWHVFNKLARCPDHDRHSPLLLHSSPLS